MTTGKIKALTLHQPWATLIAVGAKQFETRSWATSFRGPVVIHAGKTLVTQGFDRMFMDMLAMAGCSNLQALPLGVAVCVADLTACYRTEQVRPHLTAMEAAFGFYEVGRAAWKLEHIRVLTPPIPARGQQGLWDWTLPLPEGILS